MAKRLLARVKALRKTLGLSQEAFAEKAGLGYKYYQSVEAGRKRDIRLSTLEKLAKACGLELADLLDFKSAPLALAEPKGNEFIATPRKAASKAAKRTTGQSRR